MEGPKCLPCTVRQNSLLMKLDIKDAYLTGSMNPRSYQFIQFQWNTKPHQYLVMPFGLSIAPSIFTRIMKHPIKLLRAQGVSMIIYLDDILLAIPDYGTIKLHTQWTISLLTALRFVINWEKSILKQPHK